MADTVVTTESGKVRGTIEKDVDGRDFYAFRGIHYGKPTGGAARFKAPEPVEPWTGIRDATSDSDECVGRHQVSKTVVGNENCLILNIFTPTLPHCGTAALKPVMVWIHGGGFTESSNDSRVFGPDYLVAEDVVLVTVNYRLNVFGFMCFKDASLGVSGNTGLKDMVLALKWVKTNIGNFGGDTGNVTIFGESAGSAAVHFLIVSPQSEGLFHKAIMQSGCALNSWTRGRPIAIELSQHLGLNTTNERELLEHFRKVPAKELFEACEKIYDFFSASCQRPFGPVIEPPSPNAFITQEPIEIIKSGRYNHVPIMIGYTDREGMLVDTKRTGFQPHQDFELAIPHLWGLQKGGELSKLIAAKLKKFYYGDEEPSMKHRDNFYLLESDSLFIIDILNTTIEHSKNAKHPIYLYRMSIDTDLNHVKRKWNFTAPGVCHADDLTYLFPNRLEPSPPIQPDSAEDLGRRRFCKIWTNFARYSHPNPFADHLLNVEWQPVTPDQLNFVDIGRELTIGVNPEKERLDFWRDIVELCQNYKK